MKVAGFAKKAARQMDWSCGESLWQRGGFAGGTDLVSSQGRVWLMKRAAASYGLFNVCNGFASFVWGLMRFGLGGRPAQRGAGGVALVEGGWYINALVRMRILGQSVLGWPDALFSGGKKTARHAREVPRELADLQVIHINGRSYNPNQLSYGARRPGSFNRRPALLKP